MLCKKRSAFRHGHSVPHATHASSRHCSLVGLIRGEIHDDKYRHVPAGLTHGLAEAEKSHEAPAALRGPGGAVGTTRSPWILYILCGLTKWDDARLPVAP